MSKMKKALAVLFSALMVCVFAAGCGQQEEAGGDMQGSETGSYRIGIIQYNEHVALDSAREGFLEALADNGYVEGENLEVDFQNAQGDQSNLSTISKSFVSQDMDLVLGIANPAVQSIAGETEEIPIVGTAVTDYVVAKLAESDEEPGYNVTGTSDMNPIEEQIELLTQLCPDAKTVGVLYTNSEDNSVLQAGLAKEYIEAAGLEYVEVTVTGTNDVQQATQSIVRQCDAIYVPTDNTFASAMPTVYGVVSESGTPVICGESGMVDSGGMATLGINYHDLGYQTGLMAIKILEGEAEPATMPIEKATNFDYVISKEFVDAIGLEVPEELQEYVK